MKKVIRWVFILVPIFLLGLILVNVFHLGGNYGSAFDHGGRLSQQFGASGHHIGERGGIGMHHDVRHLQTFIFPLALLFLLVKIGLALVGYAIWKFSKETFGKLIGATVLSLALFSMLPKILGIPLLFVIAYIAYKVYKKKNNINLGNLSPVDFPHYQTRDYLDEWENSVRKEEQ